jgi:hypothetical protein
MAGQNYLPRHSERTYEQSRSNPIPDRHLQFGIHPKLVSSYFVDKQGIRRFSEMVRACKMHQLLYGPGII